MKVLLGDAGAGIVEAGSTRILRQDLAIRTRAIATVIVLVAAAVGVVQVLSPVHLNAPGARASIETAITLSALLSAALLLGHFDHSRRLRDLVLLGALVTVSITDFAFSAVPALTGVETVAFGTGARLGCMVLVSIAFGSAALAPGGKLVGGGHRLVAMAALAGLGIAGLGESLALIAGAGSSAALARSYVPISIAVGVASSGLLLLAGVAFIRRARREDTDARLLGGVCFLLSGAGLRYVLLPAVPAAWITPGDGLRLAAYALLLAFALRQHRETRDLAAEAAISAERRRLARDLHDGLAQDLAVIATHAQRLEAEVGPDHPLTIAARHALAASRGAIVDLSASGAPTTAAALRRVGDELGANFGVEVKVRVEADSARIGTDDLNRRDREHVVRIAREGVVNAIRHGGARHIEVVFDCRGGNLLLRISDDGCGIAEPALHHSRTSGFGLPTMRARAEALGGRLIARQGASGGTDLEVLVAASPMPE
jgi:signal transduction histidine kinase